MRLVTFDRRGHRRLGALLEGEVVDVPDLIGHPAFPTTMEALVGHSGGTVLDAARAALDRDDAHSFTVPTARLLAPILPRSLRGARSQEGLHRVVGPGQEVPWPGDGAWLEYEPRIAAVLGRPLRDAATDQVAAAVFGFTLVGEWCVRASTGDPVVKQDGIPVSIGPWVVTADEIDPQSVFLTVRVQGEDRAKGNLNGTAHRLLDEMGAASRSEALEAGEAFAASPFGAEGPEHRLWPGAEVELEAEGLGILRNRIARPD